MNSRRASHNYYSKW